MSDIRDTIFISHATPEDNDFTIWLASRLQLLGYKVWIDKSALVGGEKFWQTIDQIIRNEACKVILVYSNSICQNGEAGKLKDGIEKEYSLAESIAKQYALEDFLILANIDGAAYNLFIGADRLNQISFVENWAKGLIQLQKKLIKDKIPSTPNTTQKQFSEWFQYEYIIPNPIVEKKELYYSNIWPINRLPEYFFIHEFKKEQDAELLYKTHRQYPLSRITNYVSSFEADLLYLNQNELQIPEQIHYIRIADMLMGNGNSKFPTNRDAQNHFKHLLKLVFHLLMRQRAMSWYEMSNKKFAYFYTPGNLNQLKVRFAYPFRSNHTKMKNLLGTHKVINKWHFAVSSRPILTPILGFNLKTHIVFTTDGFNVWKKVNGEVDTKKIFSNRRAKGKMMYNEEWRDLFLAFLEALKIENEITIRLSSDFTLQMSSYPEMFWSKFGYFDPKDKTRHGLLAVYEEEVDEDDDSLNKVDINEGNSKNKGDEE